MDNLIGKAVLHKAYGKGNIIYQDDKHVKVEFDKPDIGEKMFSSPMCFEKFLKILDESAEIQISEAIKEKEVQKVEEEKEREIRVETEILQRKSTSKSSRASNKSKIEPPSFDSVLSFCDSYKRSVLTEMYYLKDHVTKKDRIHDGKLTGVKNSSYIYTFEAEDELNYPEGTQIKVWREDTKINGFVLECIEFTIVISVEENLGTDIPTLEVSAEPWRLLGTLAERLEELKGEPSGIVKALVCDGFKQIDSNNSKIITGQVEAVCMSGHQPITFVWGPPGTGKTQTLANIALDHIEKGHRVLMLSQSNVSVDGAVMRTFELSNNPKAGTLIRYGYTKREDVLKHPYLTAYNYVIHKHPSFVMESKKLSAERKGLQRSNPRYVEIGQKLSKIKHAMRQEEIIAVKNASFVATTVSKATVDGAIYNDKFDVVIFDEASMAYVPQIVFAAGLAKKHFICMGDFVQLPPIVQGERSQILNIDIFRYCGITDAVEENRRHNWLCMLDTQYRMYPQIADFASVSMYNGLLKSADIMKNKRGYIVGNEPFAGNALALADLTGMLSVCMKTKDKSRINILSAFVSLLIAVKAAKNTSVGIITPYHAQSRLIHAMIKDINVNYPDLCSISCATVHQFQGSEEDVIVYDSVDCYRMTYPGMLLTSMENDYANRLFNVALTRARGKFICVSNMGYMFNKNISSKLMFGKLLDTKISHARHLGGPELLKEIENNKYNKSKLFNEEFDKSVYLEDLRKSRKEIHIDIPDNMKDMTWTSELVALLNEKKKQGVKVYIRTENKGILSTELKRLAVENKYVYNPLTIIDKSVVWYGAPESESYFVSEGIALNTPFHPILRFEGKYAASAIYGYIDMDNILDMDESVVEDSKEDEEINTFAAYVRANTKCPECGNFLELKRGKSGKFFLACKGYPSCDHKEFVTVDLIEKYFRTYGPLGKRCDICNCSLEAKLGKYGVYIQCCGMERHKYKMDEI